jgi:ABC-2 type transport system permease protein/oleandomycin transport system permease protein
VTVPAIPSSVGTRVRWAATDAFTLTWRNLLRYVRLPQLLVFSTIQPVVFVLLFAFVFGGAIQVPGVDYVQFLIPGIVVQATVFGSTQTGIGLADDLSRGMVDRFRSLPMARSAVLAGRTLSDTVRNTFVALLMVVVGYLIGFRFEAGPWRAAAMVALVVALGFAFSWISATIGLTVKDPESAQAAGFIWLFPVVFASSIFVPVSSMPDWLRPVVEVNPITLTANATRALALGGPFARDLLGSLAWIAGLLGVFVPLSVRRYRRRA